jgi:hypothetical protein
MHNDCITCGEEPALGNNDNPFCSSCLTNHQLEYAQLHIQHLNKYIEKLESERRQHALGGWRLSGSDIVLCDVYGRVPSLLC